MNVRPGPDRTEEGGPIRDLKHNALELQLPRRPARFPGDGTTASPRGCREAAPGPFESRPSHCPARDTGAPRPPESSSEFARHLSRPQRQDLRSPRPGGPRPVPAPLGPAPAAVSASATAATAAHFRFPRTAGAATAAEKSPQASAPPRPAPKAARPRLCARAGTQASSDHAGVRAWEGKPTPPSGFCACPRTGRRRSRLRAGSCASSWITQVQAGPEDPGPSRPHQPALNVLLLIGSSSDQTFHSILAHLLFILLDTHRGPLIYFL